MFLLETLDSYFSFGDAFVTDPLTTSNTFLKKFLEIHFRIAGRFLRFFFGMKQQDQISNLWERS